MSYKYSKYKLVHNLIYAAKPQRGGRNIQANTNNPPQDPPPPPEILTKDDVFIPIENTAPTVPEVVEIPEVNDTESSRSKI